MPFNKNNMIISEESTKTKVDEERLNLKIEPRKMVSFCTKIEEMKGATGSECQFSECQQVLH